MPTPIRSGSQDKDQIIRELQKKNDQQASQIAMLEATIASLKLQVSYRNDDKRLDEVGGMTVSFTK